ncbi:type III PLP-dependent enzyme [Plantactinospora sp. KLBMP9567]|uniref:type III PLP-dependent enzyme n=1 Tax=Plantactinospora sp. KLBMP9567 TaxID=3085900 RepID=UPI002980C461|nr:type III PLP-dependent enzyme [Plantactinospora sp. KLBMP9567]MDW5329527.1 type III PLP-dependent enzyme [Plantactinospora sp. KLBMP9567]
MSSELRIGGVAVSELADAFGTPLFAYDGDVLTAQFRDLRDSLHPALEIFFSLKSNPNVAICALLRSLGARAEVSSLAELITARRAGVPPADIVFPGPGKDVTELAACLDQRVHAIICESLDELRLVDFLARERGRVARVALRVNPSFTVTGSKLTMGGRSRQFGIDERTLLDAPEAVRSAHVHVVGVHIYMGTRILDEPAIVRNTEHIFETADRLARVLGFPLELVDIGGGLGVAYFDGERDLDRQVLTDALNPVVDRFAATHPRTRLVMELGRYLTAPAGTYITRVRYVKSSMGERYAVVDGGTHQHMAAVGLGSFVKRNFPMRLLNRLDEEPDGAWHVAGPLCTPNDVLGKAVPMPAPRAGDLVGVLRSGAYGPTASPVLFLGHGYPAEVLVHGGRAHLVRARDGAGDVLRGQLLPEFLQPDDDSVMSERTGVSQ